MYELVEGLCEKHVALRHRACFQRDLVYELDGQAEESGHRKSPWARKAEYAMARRACGLTGR
jgi:hypothetical protein